MNSRNPSPIFSHLSLTPFLLLFRISSADDGNWLYDSCATTFSCGFITGLGYPFRAYTAPANCSYPGLALNCQGDIPTIQIMNLTYRLLNLNLAKQTMVIAREDAVGSVCPRDLVNTTVDNSLFEYSPGYVNLTFFYGCPAGSIPSSLMPVSGCTVPGYKEVYWLPGSVVPFQCKVAVTVPVSPRSGSINSTNLGELLGGGVEVTWKVDGSACSNCRESKGRCGFDFLSNQTTCFCPDPPYVSATCAVDAGAPSLEPSLRTGSSSSERTVVVLVLTIASAVLVILIFIVVVYLIRRRHLSLIGMLGLRKKETLDDQNVKVFMRRYGSLAPTQRQYRYSDIAKMTNSFKDKIGKGGYGTVYKGKLNDGRLVAVKVLRKTKGNGEEFINEVASISRTSHVNVVALLGFCFERKKRALVYEFMANGSLNKFIHNNESQTTNCHLEWRTMYQIAVGIAQGLEYLHRGCSTRIVHFDIKPHNILLDEDFCPKISDFGLAKLCERKQSIMSMLGTRGTIGYIAPELFSRAFGGVSHKSDVYSYGMLILEMSGATQKIEVAQTSEKYFPHWIHEHLEHGKDLSLQRITSAEDEETARKMILVGLWCIQTNPSDRPAMSKVVEMLEGSIQSMQIPPKPFLFSPARSAPCSQDSSMSFPTTNHAVKVPEGRLKSMPIPPKPLNLPPSRPHQTS